MKAPGENCPQQCATSRERPETGAGDGQQELDRRWSRRRTRFRQERSVCTDPRWNTDTSAVSGSECRGRILNVFLLDLSVTPSSHEHTNPPNRCGGGRHHVPSSGRNLPDEDEAGRNPALDPRWGSWQVVALAPQTPPIFLEGSVTRGGGKGGTISF